MLPEIFQITIKTFPLGLFLSFSFGFSMEGLLSFLSILVFLPLAYSSLPRQSKGTSSALVRAILVLNFASSPLCLLGRMAWAPCTYFTFYLAPFYHVCVFKFYTFSHHIAQMLE